LHCGSGVLEALAVCLSTARAGAKASAVIELVGWQQTLVERHPGMLLRGLIHSDGARVLNRVNGAVYPRYEFSNASPDILSIYCRALERVGVV
jgi:hypothetical protein